ncbi:MAG: hypothetical protein AAGA66_17485, partial [Bacteroidota bacterium]
ETFERVNQNLRYRGRIRFRNHYHSSFDFTKNEIKAERKRSYYGSFTHFKKALLSNKLRKEGFRIYETKSLRYSKLKKIQAIDEKDVLVFKGKNWELGFNNYLLVEYMKERESPNFLMDAEFSSILYEDFIHDDKISRQPSKQVSILKLLDGPVELDLNGQIINKFAMTSYGYWSWERLANLVPLNYDPKFDNF